MYKNILLILLSSCTIYFSIDKFGYLFLSIPAFLLLSYNLSDLALKIVHTKDNKTKKEKNLEFFVFFGLLPIIFFIRDFEQTIGGYVFFWQLVFCSLLFSITTVLIFK